MPTPRGYRHKKLRSKRSCARGSFRRVRSGAALVTVCCPRGKWKRERCKIGMKAVGIDRPRFSDLPTDLAHRGDCAAARREVARMPAGLRQDYAADRVEELCSVTDPRGADLDLNHRFYGVRY